MSLETKHRTTGATNVHDTNPRIQMGPLARFLCWQATISAALFLAAAVCAPAQDAQKTGDESWTKSTEQAEQNVTPSRTTESHTKSGNRTVDKQKVEVLGPNGRYQPFLETETETIQVDPANTRTVVRTYQWTGNGQRILSQVSEENSQTSASGDLRVERKTSSADINGNFRVTQREVADTKKAGSGEEETKSSVYRADSYGGFTKVGETQELKTRGTDDSVRVKKTTLLPDGNGGFKVSGVTEKTVKDDGQSRTTEERVSTADLEGRLQEGSRTVAKETETASGEKKSIVETYDGTAQLNKRVTRTQKKDSSGEIIEEKIEGANLGNPSDGPKVTGRTKYVVKYAGPGTQQTKTVEIRDANGNYKVVSSGTQASNQPPASQNAPAGEAKPEEPAPKPH